jgi:hypothetical protein
MLLFTGTKDHLQNSIDFGFERRAAIPRYLVTMENANHGSFFDVCNWLEFALANGAPTTLIARLRAEAAFLCADDLIDPLDSIELTAFYSVAFLNAHLLQNPEYQTFLTSAFASANNLPLEVDAVVPEPSTIALVGLMCVGLIQLVARHPNRIFDASAAFGPRHSNLMPATLRRKQRGPVGCLLAEPRCAAMISHDRFVH